MNQHEITWPSGKNALYPYLLKQLTALLEGCPPISALSNTAALLWEALPDINWVGFYLLKDNFLYLGPFQGKTACMTIHIGQGVCGTAAATQGIQIVPDVHHFPGHIACDSASNSEIVIPLTYNNQLIGVMDLDSPLFARFDAVDADGLQGICHLLTNAFDWSEGLL